MGIDIEIVLGYQHYLPDIHPGADGYWYAQCPWCEGRLEIGLANSETGKPTDWLCQGCAREGSLEELGNSLSQKAEQDIAQPANADGEPEFEEASPKDPAIEPATGVLEFGGVEESESAGFSIPEEENLPEIDGESPIREAEKPKVSSDLRIPGEIEDFLTLDLPTRELQILIYLQIRGYGISAKTIGEELRLPEKNVHRYLAGLEKKRLVYSQGRPKRFLRIEDSRLRVRFRRGSASSEVRIISNRENDDE